ncbi:hypothetical protein GCM10027422_34210 [Hymenobacter arcticus]
MPVRNGQGYYVNGGQQFGGGKIIIYPTSFAITTERGAIRPNITGRITRKETKSDRVTYYSSTSWLVVFPLGEEDRQQRQQIQYDAEWNPTMKLFGQRILFVTSSVPTVSEAASAAKQQALERKSEQQQAYNVLKEQIAAGKVFSGDELATCQRFTGNPQNLIAYYQGVKSQQFFIPVTVDEIGEVSVGEGSGITIDLTKIQPLIKFSIGKVAIARDTFKVKTLTGLQFEPDKYARQTETLVATYKVKKIRKAPFFETATDATPDIQAKVRSLINFEQVLAGRADGEYQFQYLEQQVTAHISVKGSLGCEAMLIASQPVPKPLFKYRKVETYADWHVVP